jgi:HD-like signal output (HDOD) protein
MLCGQRLQFVEDSPQLPKIAQAVRSIISRKRKEFDLIESVN